MKALLSLVGVALAMLVSYLLLWPTPIAPVAWQPAAIPTDARYAANDVLAKVQRLGANVGRGPEGIALDDKGNVYAGLIDGRVVVLAHNGASFQQLATIEHGRPLGLALAPGGGVLIADAYQGLLRFDGQRLSTVATAVAGKPLKLVDDVVLSADGRSAYFSDATRYAYDDLLLEFLEHRGSGRLIRLDLQTGESQVLLEGLHFGNGVTLGPDEAYVLINETAAYRVTRYWLKGEKAGSHDLFIDNLPGLPDNISYSPATHRFWLALYSPRDAQLDALAPKPAWIKKLVARLPRALQPRPPHKAWVLALDEQGQVIANLQHDGADAYAPITSARESGPWLYLGSLTAQGFARLPLNAVFADAPAPPAGWQQAPVKAAQFRPIIPDDKPDANR